LKRRRRLALFACAFGFCRAVRETADGALLAETQIAHLRPDGTLRVPDGTRHVAIEIGCSDFDTMDVEWLPREPHGFLLAFEPLLDKFAVLLSRGTRRYHANATDQAVPLGHHHPRGIVLPLAVSERGGPVTFTVGSVAGCSSLRTVNTASRWGHHCKRTLERRLVDSVSLTRALRMVPAELPISMLKLDAQGVDFDLLRTLDDRDFDRVLRVQIEAVPERCTRLYAGQATCETIMAHMRAVGFKSVAWSTCPRKACEVNLVFRRERRNAGGAGRTARSQAVGA
jgi:hypothetical protein